MVTGTVVGGALRKGGGCVSQYLKVVGEGRVGVCAGLW